MCVSNRSFRCQIGGQMCVVGGVNERFKRLPSGSCAVIDGVVLDVDGTVVRGRTALAGAPAAVGRLHERGIQPVFCSNNPLREPAAYAAKLQAAGIPLPEAAPSSFVVTAGTATAAYLTDTHPEQPAYVFGESALAELLAAAGVTVTDDAHAASVAVVSIDYEFGYDTLRLAIRAIDEETTFVGTDPDPVIPADDGPAPGSGAMVRAIRGVLDREPDAIAGKPGPTAGRLVGERLGSPPERTLVVGDRLDTDIALGDRIGAKTALVTTGVTDAAAVAASPYDPDYVLDSIAEIDRVLDAEA